MQYKCHLCKLRFERDEAGEVRCPRCEAKVKAPVAEAAPVESSRQYGCPSCLRLFDSSNSALMRCRYCDERVEPAEGERLVAVVTGAAQRVRKGLLEGQTPSSQVKTLQEQGIPEDRAFAFVDRLVLELPFDRWTRRQNKESITPARECDACGRVEDLTAWEAEWRVPPEELQRYRSGWGGFEGEFSDPTKYARKAYYYLCKACSKENPTRFAGGYPAKNGFTRTKFTRG